MCTVRQDRRDRGRPFRLSYSLRGRRLKGKGEGVLAKGVLGARETRGAREGTPFPKTPSPFPFKRLPRRLPVLLLT